MRGQGDIASVISRDGLIDGNIERLGCQVGRQVALQSQSAEIGQGLMGFLRRVSRPPRMFSQYVGALGADQVRH